MRLEEWYRSHLWLCHPDWEEEKEVMCHFLISLFQVSKLCSLALMTDRVGMAPTGLCSPTADLEVGIPARDAGGRSALCPPS